jgi:hypothetical protein
MKSRTPSKRKANQSTAPDADPSPSTPVGRFLTKSRDGNSPDSMHSVLMGAAVYRGQLNPALLEDLKDTAVKHVGDTLLRMSARDPLEEMLIAQTIWTHTRLGKLSAIANDQTHSNHVRVVNDACDRASNTFRRQMLALAEYRRPPRTDSFTAIKQLNQAQQQVVQNVENQNSKLGHASNEKGLPTIDAAALPAHTEGAGFAAQCDSTGEAVAANHRPADCVGKGSLPNERAEAR